MEALRRSFCRAFSRAEELVVLSGDDVNFKKIMPKISVPTITFGRGRENMYRYDITSFMEGNFAFDLYKFDNKIGSFRLRLPGAFNVHNATAAIVVAIEMGLDIDMISEAVSAFGGIPRRLEHIGYVNGRAVYYDYAHHPTEIGASVTTLKGLLGGELTVVFKPHTYSRTASLWDELCGSLSLADYIILTDIYGAREEPIPGITSENLARDIGECAAYVPDLRAAEYILKNTRGSIVLMGAGDLTEIKNQLIR
jgi:UDP-N-acetylmuramate--alanine ligase